MYEMPKRRTRRRRKFRKRRNGNGLVRHVSNNPVPSRKLVKFKFVEQVGLDPSIGSMAHFLFNANSIFDANRTGGGHFPLGAVQWNPFYNVYTVVRADIKVTFMSTVSTNLGQGIVGIYLNDDTVSTNVMDTMIEYQRTNHAIIGGINSDLTSAIVRHSYTPQKMFGRPIKSYIGSNSGQGLMLTTSPTDLAIFDIFSGPIVSASDMAGIDLLVEIWYTVMLTDRETLPGG